MRLGFVDGFVDRFVDRFVGVALAVLASSLGLPACGPMVDSAAKADLDSHLAQIHTSEETYAPAE